MRKKAMTTITNKTITCRQAALRREEPGLKNVAIFPLSLLLLPLPLLSPFLLSVIL